MWRRILRQIRPRRLGPRPPYLRFGARAVRPFRADGRGRARKSLGQNARPPTLEPSAIRRLCCSTREWRHVSLTVTSTAGLDTTLRRAVTQVATYMADDERLLVVRLEPVDPADVVRTRAFAESQMWSQKHGRRLCSAACTRPSPSAPCSASGTGWIRGAYHPRTDRPMGIDRSG